VCWVKWAVKSIPPSPLPATTLFNLLKYTRNFTYHLVQHSKILRCDHIAFMCFVWISEQTENLPWLIFITEVESAYCAIRAGCFTQIPFVFKWLTLILLMCRIWWAPNNASKWQMGFNSAFKWLTPFAGSLAFHSHTQLRSKTSIRANDQVSVNTSPTRCNSMQILINYKVTLHVSGVTAPIIRSTKNCNRSLRYRS